MNLSSLIRAQIRTRLINDGPQTCSDLVRALGLDPRRHKGTIHALMVDLEREGILTATLHPNGKRNEWSIFTDRIRKRDRIFAAMIP